MWDVNDENENNLEKDFDTDEYKDLFKNGRAVLVKIISIDDR